MGRRRAWYWRKKWRLAVVLIVDQHDRLALPRRHVVGHGRLHLREDRRDHHDAGALGAGRLRLLPLHRQLRDLHGPDADHGHLADPRLRAGRRAVGRQARRRPRPGRGEGGGAPRRHPLAVGRGVRARRRQARARPALRRRARHGQDDAREGDRDRLQLTVRLDPGLRLRADLHRDRRDHRPLPRLEGEAARAQVGRPVHRLHRRDRRRRDAPAGARRRRAGRRLRAGRHQRSPLLRPARRAQPERRPDPRDAPLARAAVRAPGARPAGAVRPAHPALEPAQLHLPRHGRDGPARVEPAARRHGRDRQPAVHEAGDDEPPEHVPRRDVHRPAAARQDPAAAAAARPARRPDLLHRRHERADRPPRSRADPARPDGPPRLVPDADEAGPARRVRPLHHARGARARPRHAEAARRDRTDHERLLAGDDRPGLLDGADARASRRPRPVRLERPRRGDDDDRVGYRGRDRVHRLGDEGGRDPRGGPRRRRPRLHAGRRVDAALDQDAGRLARPPSGAREGGALQPLPQRRDGAARLGARRDGGGARLLRRELERRRRRRPVGHGAGRLDGRRVGDGPGAVHRDAARRRERRGGARRAS